MYNIIPLFLILISLFAIIIIIIRKFSVLSSLDISSIQSEKEAMFKERIIGNRLKRNIIRYTSKIKNFLKPVGSELLSWGKIIFEKLKYFKENYNKTEPKVSLVQDLDKLIELAEEMVKEEKFDEAEKKFIEIIGLDSQNLVAFKGLGKLYYDKKQYKESSQTFEHILRLLEHDELRAETLSQTNGQANIKKIDNHYLASIYYELALVYKDGEEIKKALENILKATEIEPNNPRFLDMKLEISIINSDKVIALDALKKLKEVNPDNNKLVEFEERVRSL